MKMAILKQKSCNERVHIGKEKIVVIKKKMMKNGIDMSLKIRTI